MILISFFFNDTATTEIYTLSLHDALPILAVGAHGRDILLQFLTEAVTLSVLGGAMGIALGVEGSSILAKNFQWPTLTPPLDRKSTRLNSSHSSISYAVFCLKKKNKEKDNT